MRRDTADLLFTGDGIGRGAGRSNRAGLRARCHRRDHRAVRAFGALARGQRVEVAAPAGIELGRVEQVLLVQRLDEGGIGVRKGWTRRRHRRGRGVRGF